MAKRAPQVLLVESACKLNPRRDRSSTSKLLPTIMTARSFCCILAYDRIVIMSAYLLIQLYRLHLLLRPRRKFMSTTTGNNILGSKNPKIVPGPKTRSVSETTATFPIAVASSQSLATAQQARQHRLQQLTTQLLWRLQQSSPHHSSSATNIILPSLPEALPELRAPQEPARLLHGLEESEGALYEIGVSDDGVLVGLAEDELNESLNNLRAMAACLGCSVSVLRKEVVGECQWTEVVPFGTKLRKVRHTGNLSVAEALVRPHLSSKAPPAVVSDMLPTQSAVIETVRDTHAVVHHTEQLRITLTGSTLSGKSTLLGTLTTSTLDNGRGKSRLSMLKHRHEINSGMTSSVTQEVLGYRDTETGGVQVMNYASENIASWIDVHDAAAGSRLLLVSDSAGHPRYRRTTIRGLIGWAPHWTLLCVPADDTEDTGDKDGGLIAPQPRSASVLTDVDLSGAQLTLCLRLGLPLVVVITKLDVASRSGLRHTLTKVLDALKSAGRRPSIVANAPGAISEEDLHLINASLLDSMYQTCLPLLNDPTTTVPIVLTSAVTGVGIGTLHALLHELPLPERPAGVSACFNIEDVYSKTTEAVGSIISGRLRSGQISVGEVLFLGPFSVHDQFEDSEDSDERPARKPTTGLPTSRSFPGALRDLHFGLPRFQLPGQIWRRVKVSSIRNLRLPVHTLSVDQVGTIAILADEVDASLAKGIALVRKGMVLSAIQPVATRTLSAIFKREDLELLAVGNHVVLYIASVRASAKVVSARVPNTPDENRTDSKRESAVGDVFDFDGLVDTLPPVRTTQAKVAGAITAPNLVVTFKFDAAREFVAVGDQILVMPGGGPGLYGGNERGEKGVAGLDGFVGKVEEIFE